MSEFDNLKDDAQKLAQDHPEQVQKGEQAVEDRLGLGQHDDGSQQGGNPSGDDQGSGQQDQDIQQNG